ncbi:MAG TPA: BsaWI family type II restriction enzyme [Candidatus Paceibacterota bacterium]
MPITGQQIQDQYYNYKKEHSDSSFIEAWHAAKRHFRGEWTVGDGDFEQSWKSASGGAFEEIVISRVLILLKTDFPNVVAKRQAAMTTEEKAELHAKKWRKCANAYAEITNRPDIVIFKDGRPKVILSCKSSLRDRVSIDLFWAGVYQEKNIKFVVVSAESNLATHDKPNTHRTIAECVYERLYIVNGDTDYCDVIRPFSEMELKSDLAKWLS